MSISEYSKWCSSNGDSTLRLDYDLTEESVVFDLGGYKGDWTDKISNKYNCNIYVFEPIKEFFNALVVKFSGNSKIKVYNYAIEDTSYETKISLIGDSSSIYIKDEKSEDISVKSIFDFLDENNISSIDLIKINIEGSEFKLLESILEKNHQNIFKNFQVQFHKNVDNYDSRRNLIREKLSSTHELTYDFEFIWENWKRK